MSKTVWFLGFLVSIIFILAFAPVFHIDDSVNSFTTLIVGAVFVLIHGSKALGWRNVISFIAITYLISFVAEVVGVATGLVFGPYHYSDNLGPKILGVPPMIQIGYIAMGYASLMTARVLLNTVGTNIKNWGSVFGVSLIGSFIMVAWDVAMDPYQSTYAGDWVWHTGGPYFGIGLHNFIGWFLTVFVFMFVYQSFARIYLEKVDKEVSKSRLFWSLPTLYYAFVALGMIVVPIIGGVSLPYAASNNYSGTLLQFTQSVALIAFFVMGTPVSIALTKLFLGNPKSTLDK